MDKTYLNRAACRRLVLRLLKDHRPGLWDLGMRSVSSAVYEELDAIVYNAVKRWVDTHPGKGKTFSV